MKPAPVYWPLDEVEPDEPPQYEVIPIDTETAPARRLHFQDVALWLDTLPPEQKFILDRLLPSGVVAGLHAEGGLGKSFLMLIAMISVAIGRTLFPSCPVPMARRVLLFCGEDAAEDLHRRIARIVAVYPLTAAERQLLADNLKVCCTGSMPLLEATPGGAMRKTDFFDLVKTEIEAVQPGLVVFDPRSAFFSGDENSNAQVAAYMYEVSALTKLVSDGVCILFCHHVAKANANGDLSSGRGASAARDAMRCVLHMERLSENEIAEAGIVNPNLFCKVTHTKSNYTERAAVPIYFQRETGENGGVLREIDLMDMKHEIQSASAENLAKAMAKALGNNPKNWTYWEVIKNNPGKLLREHLIGQFGKKAVTQDTLKNALDYAVRHGLIVMETEVIGGMEKQTPRMAVQ